MNWGRPIRAWSNPFGDLYGRGPPRGGKGTFTEEQVVRGGYAEFARQQKLSTWNSCLQSEKLQPFQPSTFAVTSHMSPCRFIWLLDHPSSCAFWCWKTKVGGSLSIVVGWPGAAKKYPNKYKALKHLLALLENCLMLVIPECATEWPLEVVCVVWNFLLREAIFSCPRVETTSRRQAGTGFQGINCSYPIQGQVLRIVTRGWPVSGPSDGNRSPASRQ